jgi:peptide deformylase
MIITDEKLLRQPCIDVLPEEVGELVDLLERELKASSRPGIGLAAIQIGIPKKIAIVCISPRLQVNLINCRIAKQYDPALFQGEGCLSIPDKTVDTMRYQEVYVVDNLSEQKSFVATGLMAVAVQHEIDHWNNITMLERAIKPLKAKQRPNDPCACQSGKKYKRCCG